MSNNPKSPKPLDRTDRHILECLQANGRMSSVALAKKVNLTTTPCLQRVRRLERDGFIKGYAAQLNPELLDASLLVFVEITCCATHPAHSRNSDARPNNCRNCWNATWFSGNFDYLLKARVKDMHEYRTLLGEKILALPGVSDSRSYMVMEEIKETMSLPLFKD